MTISLSTRRGLLSMAGALPVIAADAASSAKARRAAAASPITLVGLFPDSGAQSLAGDEAWRGVALAVAAANRRGPPHIRLLRADAADAEAAIGRLAKSSPPAACLGTLSSTRSFAATAAAELANIPYIELDAPADGITGRGFKSLLRTGLTTTDLAGTAATAIAGQIAPAWHQPTDKLRVALLFDDGASNGAFAAAMIAIAALIKLPIRLIMGYATNSMDLTAQTGRMKRAKIDLLIHAGRTEHALLLYEALAVTAWRPRMILGIGTGYGQSALGMALGPTLENTMVVDAPLYPPGADPIALGYRRHYATNPRSSASLTSYIGTTLVITALAHPTSLITTLSQIDLPRNSLANGWGARFDNTGQNQNSFATLQQWRHGHLTTVDPTIPYAAPAVIP